MLASELRIDLVHVCTPPYVHAEIAINSMNAGKHVIVEKPMATCLADVDDMLEAEKERNNVVMSLIAQNRFRNSIYRLKRWIAVLPVKYAGSYVNSYWWRGHSYYDLWWRSLGEGRRRTHPQSCWRIILI